ncbi:hypothetical protein [Actinomadura sp. WMMA1423]|uniref:DUF7352 domain-containing protein n=1 Tax=Actinomadura sp. WMMA1423 TaxID=2591108 RepID=UPI0011477C74|nr:hypothetical protein [Actinomadura sp. WMMA1423]
MAERMYRYVVPVDDKPHTIELAPGRAAELGPLHLSATASEVEFWALHSDEYAHRPLPFTFQVFGTGQPIPPCALWRGTAPRTREGLVWHLFELRDAEIEPGVAVVRGERYELTEGTDAASADLGIQHAASAALDAMRAGDRSATNRALNQLQNDHGMAGITTALMHWCDAALEVMPVRDGPVGLSWLDTETGRVQTTDAGVPITEQWACRLIAARANGDRDAFTALVKAVPDEAIPAHVGAMVQMAACIIQEANG